MLECQAFNDDQRQTVLGRQVNGMLEARGSTAPDEPTSSNTRQNPRFRWERREFERGCWRSCSLTSMNLLGGAGSVHGVGVGPRRQTLMAGHQSSLREAVNGQLVHGFRHPLQGGYFTK